MALRDSKLFRAIAYTTTGLALLSFALAVLFRVASGHGADIYVGGRGLHIPNAAALVTIIALLLLLVFWLAQRGWQRWRHLFVRKSGA